MTEIVCCSVLQHSSLRFFLRLKCRQNAYLIVGCHRNTWKELDWWKVSPQEGFPLFPQTRTIISVSFQSDLSPSFYKRILQWCFHCVPQTWCPTDTPGLSLHCLQLHSSLNNLITLTPPLWIPSNWTIFSFSCGVHSWTQCSVELQAQFMPPWGFLSLQEPFSSLSPSLILWFQPRGKMFAQRRAGCKFSAKPCSGWRENCLLYFSSFGWLGQLNRGVT